MHDASKVLMGTTQSSEREISCEDADPASFAPGVAVSRNSSADISTAASAGGRIGITAGASLSDHKKLAVIRTGERVPMKLKDEGEFSELEHDDLTFRAAVKGEDGDNITIALVDDGDAGDETVDV